MSSSGGVATPAAARAVDRVPQRVLRNVLGQYATGVAVVTTLTPAGCPVGMTINSFSSLSLDPPLILWCLNLDSANLGAFMTADHFVINVLATDQERVARLFADHDRDRFADLSWHPGLRGMPLLDGRLGAFTCRRAEHIRRGDHLIVIGQLDGCEVIQGRAPLVFYNGSYHACLPEYVNRPPPM